MDNESPNNTQNVSDEQSVSNSHLENRRFSLSETALEFIGVIAIPILLGLVLAFAPYFFGVTGNLRDLLTNIGFGLAGTGVGAAIPLVFVRRTTSRQANIESNVAASLRELRQEISGVSEAVAQDISLLNQAVKTDITRLNRVVKEDLEHIGTQVKEDLNSISALVRTANSLGIVALGAGRGARTFEEGKTLADRWVYLLKHADVVELLCYEDSELLKFDLVATFQNDVLKRLREAKLKLRIILSTDDNPVLPMIGRWIDDEDHSKRSLKDNLNTLSNITHEFPIVLLRHNEMIPFTLLRGDTYMYVMFFFPGHGPGPIIELRQAPARDVVASSVGQDPDYFKLYCELFDKMWKKLEAGKANPA